MAAVGVRACDALGGAGCQKRQSVAVGVLATMGVRDEHRAHHRQDRE